MPHSATTLRQEISRPHSILAEVARAVAHRENLDGRAGVLEQPNEGAVFSENGVHLDVGHRCHRPTNRELSA